MPDFDVYLKDDDIYVKVNVDSLKQATILEALAYVPGIRRELSVEDYLSDNQKNLAYQLGIEAYLESKYAMSEEY